jgi:hypothetical protein
LAGRVEMKAIIRPEGAGWVIEICGDDCPVDRYFVKEIDFHEEAKVEREEDCCAVRYPCTLPNSP